MNHLEVIMESIYSIAIGLRQILRFLRTNQIQLVFKKNSRLKCLKEMLSDIQVDTRILQGV